MIESEHYRQVKKKMRNWLIIGWDNRMRPAVQTVSSIVVDKFNTSIYVVTKWCNFDGNVDKSISAFQFGTQYFLTFYIYDTGSRCL